MENTLDGFGGWDNVSAETDFFTETTPVVEIEKEIVVEKEKEEISTDDKEDNFFEKEDVATNKKVEEKENNNIDILNSLKEKGYLDYQLEEGEELTTELADELIEEGFATSVDNKVKELISELPEQAKDLIQYLTKGGSLNEFVNNYTNDLDIDLESDLDDEDTQIDVLKKLLSLEDKDKEEIETEVEYLKDSGKLKLITEKKFNKYKIEVEEEKKDLLAEQKKQIDTQNRLTKEAKNKISNFVQSNNEVDGITFSKEDKKELPSYMNDKTVKLQNGTTITQMQKELFYDLPKNENALIQLATLLKNRNPDGSFNFKSIANKERTNVTKEIKQQIRRTVNNTSGKTIADYFNNN
jgi:hypothetical protein